LFQLHHVSAQKQGKLYADRVPRKVPGCLFSFQAHDKLLLLLLLEKRGRCGRPQKKKKKKKKKAGFSHAIYLQVQGGPEEYLYVTKGLTKPNQTFRNIQAGMLV
jgi:hypothetical protein